MGKKGSLPGGGHHNPSASTGTNSQAKDIQQEWQWQRCVACFAQERPVCGKDRQAMRNLHLDARQQNESDYLAKLKDRDEQEYNKLIARVRV